MNDKCISLLLSRFDRHYLLCVERIFLEKNDTTYINSYVGWSIKRVMPDEDDTPTYLHEGKEKKRFNFSGKLSSLAELHRALVYVQRSSKMLPMVTKEEARVLEKDQFGIIDITQACEPQYSNRIFAFSSFRAFITDVTYKSPAGHLVTYKGLILTKKKTDKSKSKDPTKAFFSLNIPARRIPFLVLAVELCMEANNIESIVDQDGADDEQPDETFEAAHCLEKQEVKGRKRGKAKTIKSASLVVSDESGSDDDEVMKEVEEGVEDEDDDGDGGDDEEEVEEEEADDGKTVEEDEEEEVEVMETSEDEEEEEEKEKKKKPAAKAVKPKRKTRSTRKK